MILLPCFCPANFLGRHKEITLNVEVLFAKAKFCLVAWLPSSVVPFLCRGKCRFGFDHHVAFSQVSCLQCNQAVPDKITKTSINEAVFNAVNRRTVFY